MTIKLLESVGEFCTRRNNPHLEKIKEKIRTQLMENNSVCIDRTGIKALTPSFIDELVSPLVIELGRDKIDQCLSFDPPLEGYLSEQVERGVRLGLSPGLQRRHSPHGAGHPGQAKAPKSPPLRPIGLW